MQGELVTSSLDIGRSNIMYWATIQLVFSTCIRCSMASFNVERKFVKIKNKKEKIKVV